jgi:murein DD-endopeptidase
MMFFSRLKAFFKTLVVFINNLPRKHFFALIILFVFLLIISFMPSQVATQKNIKRQLVLPNHVETSQTITPSSSTTTSSIEPLSLDVSQQTDISTNYSTNREVDYEIKSGDTVSEIFQREGISAALLQELLAADLQYVRLANLLPGQKLKLLISPDNELLSLIIIIDLANTLTFTLKDGEYVSNLETKEGEWHNSVFRGEINGSFYVNAKASGLSAGQIQQISRALGDKIDFNRQLRVGDKFDVLVAKQYIDGEYTYDSEVLAIVLKSQKQVYTAFMNEDGRYYDADGLGLSKAYRRYPFNGKYRISSPFNLKRRHPITKKISPHHGTDFAVPTGTNIYTIGDGVVERVGNHPAAGRYIVIKHSRKYTTRYLHLSKVLVHKGQSLKMGQLIAKSGNTGRSTGPHLHFEFQINGKAVNAMKVNLPLSKEVPTKQKADFNKRRDLYLKEMGKELT